MRATTVVVGHGKEGIQTFAQAIMGMQNALESLCAQIAQELNLPDRTLDFLPEDKREQGKPDSFNSVQEALDQISKPQAVYYSFPYMNLVIVDENGKKVGVRSVDLRHFLPGEEKPAIRVLIDGLKEKLNA